MKEEHCKNDHPDFPGQPCKAKLKAYATGGTFTVECWRCYGPVTFDFETEGTEAVDKLAVIA